MSSFSARAAAGEPRTQRGFPRWLVALGASAVTAKAAATTQPPTTEDARVLSMGSTAAAHAHNGAALYHNVALLHEVRRYVVTGSFAGLRVAQSAPVNGPGTSVDNDPSLVPLFLLGAGYRVHDRVVVGLGAFTTAGFGSEYDTTAPGPYRLALGSLEVSPAASFALRDDLSVGVGYRITYAFQELRARVPLPPPAPTGSSANVVSDLSGFSWFGAHVGLYYRPIEPLKFGLAYRSKTTVALSGTTTTDGEEADTSQDFSFPHGIRLGAAYEALPRRLVVALDVRYLFHAEANDELVTKTGGVETTQELDWKDSFFMGLGIEYFVTSIITARGGYSLTTSATPQDRPAPFFLPAGLLHAFHLGGGVKFENLGLAVDLGGYYGFGSSEFEGPFVPPDGPVPGKYTVDTLTLALGVTYAR
jgi:long-subunit fatty acid transport protein